MNENTAEYNRSLEIAVAGILHQLGVPSHVKGYHYLRAAIVLYIGDSSIKIGRLCSIVAREFATTDSRVERAIRHAIEIAWDRGDVDILNSFFGYTVSVGKGKPTNLLLCQEKAQIKQPKINKRV